MTEKDVNSKQYVVITNEFLSKSTQNKDLEATGTPEPPQER